jgi:hypothetical protein
MSHKQMYYYMRKAGFPMMSDIYARQHYDQMRQELVQAGTFYYVSIGQAGDYDFIVASRADFSPVCTRRLTTVSGAIDVTKMSTTHSDAAAPVPTCAPQLRFEFPLR